jgi:hypothetical protein
MLGVMQGEEEPEHLTLPRTKSAASRIRKTEFEKLKQICHPGVDKSRSPAVLKKLEELSQLPPKQWANLDPFARRGATWRVDQTMQEIAQMNDKVADIVAVGVSRRKLRNGRQRNATDRTLDPKGDLPEMMESARTAIASLCHERQDALLEEMEEERVTIKAQADEGVQREKEKLSVQRNKTEQITKEMHLLSARLAAAIEPLPEPDDWEERRRIYVRKLKKAEAKAAKVQTMLGQNDRKEMYDKSKQLYVEQGAGIRAKTIVLGRVLHCLSSAWSPCLAWYLCLPRLQADIGWRSWVVAAAARDAAAAAKDEEAQKEMTSAVVDEAKRQANAVDTVMADVMRAKGASALDSTDDVQEQVCARTYFLPGLGPHRSQVKSSLAVYCSHPLLPLPLLYRWWRQTTSA